MDTKNFHSALLFWQYLAHKKDALLHPNLEMSDQDTHTIF